MANIHQRLHHQLSKRSHQGTLRQLSIKRGLVDFSSNDYLGLSKSSKLAAKVLQKFEELGPSNGSTGSRLLTGNSSHMEALEARFADIFNGEAALIFNSGYTANLALISTIPQRGDTIIYDNAIHACVKEGARLSRARRFSFNHNDPADLRDKLKKSQGTAFVAVESLYSMDGEWAALEKILEVAEEYQAQVFLDEAHSTGWYGEGGSGWACTHHAEKRFMGRVYTFGKAVGAQGACVVGDQLLIDYLINFARPFIYTTALPDTAVVSLDCAWDHLRNNPEHARDLNKNIKHFTEKAMQVLKVPVNPCSPIQSWRVQNSVEARLWAKQLQQQGLDVRPIVSPTVKEGTERLRICIHSFNTKDEIDRLINALKEGLK